MKVQKVSKYSEALTKAEFRQRLKDCGHVSDGEACTLGEEIGCLFVSPMYIYGENWPSDPAAFIEIGWFIGLTGEEDTVLTTARDKTQPRLFKTLDAAHETLSSIGVIKYEVLTA